MGEALALAKPTKYLVKKIAIIKSRGTQLPGMVRVSCCLENTTDFGKASFIPTAVVTKKPIIHKPIVSNAMSNADMTPTNEKIIIAKGKMKIVLSFTTRG